MARTIIQLRSAEGSKGSTKPVILDGFRAPRPVNGGGPGHGCLLPKSEAPSSCEANDRALNLVKCLPAHPMGQASSISLLTECRSIAISFPGSLTKVSLAPFMSLGHQAPFFGRWLLFLLWLYE